jgi:ATP-dependent DNA helicase RecG
MTLSEIKKTVSLGEDSHRQFKADVTNHDSLAAEFVAMSNSGGGLILIGVSDDGMISGLPAKESRRVNQLIANVATQHVRSPISPRTENIAVARGRIAIAVTIPDGLEKPYFDRSGVIWLKSGSDKRRIHSREELRRFFQSAGDFHADELPTKAGLEKLDKLRFHDFLSRQHNQTLPRSAKDLARLLSNLDLATDDGHLNLAGVLLFAEHPERIKPQFIVKAVRFPGNRIHVTEYLDSEDFEGPMPAIYNGSLAFITRNLRKLQSGKGVNTLGTPEIPVSVFEELLVNALIHRDYLVSAPIRLFIFDDRIEIISPGHLPNNLTVDRILTGLSNSRNPILISYAAKGLLPYRGLGSGIPRAVEAWPKITFTDDREGNQFTATVHREQKTTAGVFLPVKGERLESRLELRLESNLAAKVMIRLGEGDEGKAGLSTALGHRSVSGELHKQIKRLLEMELIEMTIPEKPNSRLQKYRLTQKGASLLQGGKEP